MKNYFLLLLLFPLFATAQKKSKPFPFQKKDQFFSFQYGFPNTAKTYLESFPGFTTSNKKGIGPISIAYERHLQPLLSVGLSLTYSSYSADYNDAFGFNVAFTGKLRNTALMLQTIKYFESESNVLLYAKGNIGINLWSGEYTDKDGGDFKNFNAPTPVGYNAMLGLKYGFTPSTFGYIEAGYGKYIVAAGLSLKLNRQK